METKSFKKANSFGVATIPDLLTSTVYTSGFLGLSSFGSASSGDK